MERQTSSCTHHWILGAPHYGTVEGACRRCGASRTYPAGLELPEAVPDYDELADGPEAFAKQMAKREERAVAKV